MDEINTGKGKGKMDKRKRLIDVIEGIGFLLILIGGMAMDNPNAATISIALGGALILLIFTRLEDKLYG